MIRTLTPWMGLPLLAVLAILGLTRISAGTSSGLGLCAPLALGLLAIALTKPEDANDHRYGLKAFLLLCAGWSWLGAGLGLAADAAFGWGHLLADPGAVLGAAMAALARDEGNPSILTWPLKAWGRPEDPDRFARKALHDLLLAYPHLLNRDLRTQASARPDWAFVPKGDNHPNPQGPWALVLRKESFGGAWRGTWMGPPFEGDEQEKADAMLAEAFAQAGTRGVAIPITPLRMDTTGNSRHTRTPGGWRRKGCVWYTLTMDIPASDASHHQRLAFLASLAS